MLQPDYASAILSSTLPRKEELAALVKPAILAHALERADDLPIGASRLGGTPDLPPEIAWPTRNGRPQAFIAQINLAELPQIPDRELLPNEGWLYFFYAIDCSHDDPLPSGLYPSEKGAFPVFYSGGPRHAMVRTPLPNGIDARNRYDGLRFTFSTFNTFPDSEHPLREQLGYDRQNPSHEDLWKFVAEIEEKSAFKAPAWGCNQILGYPRPDQWSVCIDIEKGVSGYHLAENQCLAEGADALHAAIERRALEWELLLQVDTQDDKNGMIWGDCGKIYYMIRREDLVARKFDRVWLTLQCG